MTKSKSASKIYIISGIVALIGSVIFCSILTILFLNLFVTPTPTTPENSEPAPMPQLPTLNVPSSMTLELLQQGTIIYSIKDLGNYSLCISIQDLSIATISNSTITPKKIGTTKIIYTINTSPQIVKETTIEIVDCTKEVEFFITTEENTFPNIYYTNTYYILETKHNLLPNETPTITYGNISEFILIKTENNSFFFKFKIKNAGDFSFNYVGEYISLNKTYSAVCFPADFNLTFANSFENNKLTLYLFDTTHIEDAAKDNIFNFTTFEITPSANTVDNILLNENSYNNIIIEIIGNKITALSEGETSVEFYSTISGIAKIYNIEIIKIKLNEIVVNGETKHLNSVDNVELVFNETFGFEYYKTPTYCLDNLTLNYNPAELKYEDGKFSIIAGITNSQVTITYQNEVVYTLNIFAKLEISHKTTITQATTAVHFENNTITASFVDNFYINFNIKSFNLNTEEILPNQDFEITSISNANVCVCSDEKITNGNFTIQIVGTGICTITISDLYYNLNIQITFNIE